MSVEPVSGADSPAVPDAIVGAEVLDRPLHLARCGECGYEVSFRPSASGAAFTLVDSDAALGIGEHGQPICPNAHGEMPVVDDRIPAAEAISKVAEQTTPQQRRLPIPAPEPNWQGMQEQTADLRRAVRAELVRMKEAHDKYAARKKQADEAQSRLSEYEDDCEKRIAEWYAQIERQKEREAAGLPPDDDNTETGTLVVACAFQEKYPDVLCAICELPDVAQAHGLAGSARDSQQHIVDAELLAARLDAEDLATLIEEGPGILLSLNTILAWSVEDCEAVKAWAEGQAGLADEKPPKPKILGTAHVAGPGRNGEPQVCIMCDAVLIAGDEEANYYTEGALVGVACKPVGHHYPKKTGKKKRTTAAADDGPVCAHGRPSPIDPEWAGEEHCAGCLAESQRAQAAFDTDVKAGKYDAEGYTPAERTAQAKKRGKTRAEA